MNLLLIVALWVGYCALHSYLISTAFTERAARLLKNYYAVYRLAYVVVSLLLLVPLISVTDQFEGAALITYPMPFSIVQAVLMWSALAMFAWAFVFDYDPLSFFGIRQLLSFGKPAIPHSAGTIKKQGLLGIVRHPMYLALIIFLWCQIYTVTDAVVNAVLTVYVLIGTLLEEKKLIREFGDEYVTYQQEVPMLIPFSKRKTAERA